jgi:hypothetical protein
MKDESEIRIQNPKPETTNQKPKTRNPGKRLFQDRKKDHDRVR